MRINVPIRIILPTVQLILAIGLFALGDYQLNEHRKMVRDSATGRTVRDDPWPESLETGRFVDYAINAPAWVAKTNTPWVLTSPLDPSNRQAAFWRGIKSGRDWWYLLYIALMWFWIGLLIDQRLASKKLDLSPAQRWRKSALGSACLAYGAFMLWTHPSFGMTRHYEIWFIASVLLWGALLVVAGLGFLYLSRADRRHAPM